MTLKLKQFPYFTTPNFKTNILFEIKDNLRKEARNIDVLDFHPEVALFCAKIEEIINRKMDELNKQKKIKVPKEDYMFGPHGLLYKKEYVEQRALNPQALKPLEFINVESEKE